MTRIANFNDAEFLGSQQLNAAASVVLSGQEEDIIATHSPGLINPGQVTVTASGMVFTFTCSTFYAGLFGNGFLGKAHGTSAGADTQVYTVDLTSYVPGSGTQVVYIAHAGTGVNESPFTVQGPPPGHPDYDPAFAPYTAYASAYNTLTFSATTSAPDNSSSLEFGRITLSAGQSSVLVSQLDLSHQVYAGSILNHTGVTAGAYTLANVTVGLDGRITAIAASGEATTRANADTTLQTNINTEATTRNNADVAIVQSGGGFVNGSPGSYNFTVPADIYTILIEIWGAGGGGGGSTGGASGGRGGGGGGYIWALVSVTPTAVIPYVVGTGGAGGVNGNGTTGGSTTMFSGTLNAQGGGGGGWGNGAFATAGGAGGAVSVSGSPLAVDAIAGIGGGLPGSFGTLTMYCGQGGGSFATSNAQPSFVGYNTATQGLNGLPHGGGGSGGVAGGQGGVGANGAVKVSYGMK